MQISSLITLCLASVVSVAISSPTASPSPSKINPDEFKVTVFYNNVPQENNAEMVKDTKGKYISLNIFGPQITAVGKCVPYAEWVKHTKETKGLPKFRIERTLKYEKNPLWPKKGCDYVRFQSVKNVTYYAVYGKMESPKAPAQNKDFDIEVKINDNTRSEYLYNQKYKASLLWKKGRWVSMEIVIPPKMKTRSAKCVNTEKVKIEKYTGTITRNLGYSKSEFPPKNCQAFKIHKEYFQVRTSKVGPSIVIYGPKENRDVLHPTY